MLSIPATSAASERNWSTFGFIHNKLHNRMLNQRVEKCVYLYWNMKILRGIKEKTETNIVNELDNIVEIEENDLKFRNDNSFDNFFFEKEDFNISDLNSDDNINDISDIKYNNSDMNE